LVGIGMLIYNNWSKILEVFTTLKEADWGEPFRDMAADIEIAWEDVKTFMGGLPEWIKDAAAEIWQGMIGATDNHKPIFLESVIAFFTYGLFDAIRDLFDMESPSQVMYDFGVDIIQGLINGIWSLADALRTTLEDIVADALGALAPLLDALGILGINLKLDGKGKGKTGEDDDKPGVAHGGVIPHRMDITAGEGGEPEGVIPLSKFPQMVASYLGLVGEPAGGPGGGVSVNITVGSVRSEQDIRAIVDAVKRALVKDLRIAARY
jgi:hypothetical protein